MVAPVVDATWVAQRRAQLVLADVRWYLDGRSGRAAYDAGHLPGAVFVDLDAWLAAPPGAAGRHPLPEPTRFADGLGRLGLDDDDTVVAYDDAGGVSAARLVWMLRATGHDAGLLDGGLAAWHGPLQTAAPSRPAARFTASPWPAARVASIDEAADPATVLLDAREPERYLGLQEPVDPRAGHIPGARNLPARELLDGAGRLLAAANLRARFAAVGVDDADGVVASCGSGVTACHTLLALEHAGLGQGRLFPGSWSQWSRDRARPVSTGDG